MISSTKGRGWAFSQDRSTRAIGAAALAVALLVANLPGCAAEPGAVEAADNTVPPAQAASIARQFELELERLYDAAQSTEENFPGGIAAFILPDEQVFAFAVGYSDVEAGLPMTKDLRLPSGSIGKTYVAAVALQLALDGRLDLDQPISTWLGDEDWFARLPNGADLTLRILLSHTGGLIDHAFDSEEFARWAKSNGGEGQRDTYLRPRQLVEFVLDREPLFAAGAGYDYTDTGYIVAGLAIEKATGATYYDLLNELFLEPMELHFTLPADRRDLPGLAQGYAHESSELFGTPLKMVEHGLLAIHPLNEWTGGGLVNNPQDLVRWAKALYEGTAIDGDDLPQLLDIGFSNPEQPNAGYGLGVYIRQSDDYGPLYGHGGFYPGYNSQVIYFADHEIAVAVQINSDKSAAASHTMALAAVVLENQR